MKEVQALKLREDAQLYFVTICHKMLTKFGSAQEARVYNSFMIFDNNLFVFKVTSEPNSKIRSQAMMSVKFMGDTLVDQKTQKVYSYAGFERYLYNFLGDSLVYDPYVEHLWRELKRHSSR
jgi:hypothetical protein